MFTRIQQYAIQKPVIFWSFVIGSMGPITILTVPKVRRDYFGFKGYDPLPITYPLPNRARSPPNGYEDST
ncbi:MAG: hypothetical protein EXX96DRAFT_554710 [Benjaminiella poitrasii]|nr:MAG: hypothetical protein EXX96DRAFT_554710 [Benjaminiella poitrasii]